MVTIVHHDLTAPVVFPRNPGNNFIPLNTDTCIRQDSFLGIKEGSNQYKNHSHVSGDD